MTTQNSTLVAIRNSVFTIIVVAGLATMAYAGLRTGWAAPMFLTFASAENATEAEDWCEEHNVPESRCIKCHPELVGANMKDWCPEHGVPESKCTICHPEILTTGVPGDWCPEHGIPESSCTLCHPEIAVVEEAPKGDTTDTVTVVSEDGDDTSSAATPRALVRPSDGSPRTAEPTAPKKPAGKDPKTCQTHQMRVQFASPEAVKKAGVKLAQVEKRPVLANLTANAESEYDRTRVAEVSSPVSGKVWRVLKEVGDSVAQGEILALLDAADVGKAKAELLQAEADLDLKQKTLRRLGSSAKSGFRTQAELEEAEAHVTAAEIRFFNAEQALVNLGLPLINAKDGKALAKDLKFAGLPRSLTDPLDPKTTTANLLPLVAPLDGVVTERNLVAGEVVSPTKPLFVVADTSRMWVTADVPLSDVPKISLGQRVTFRPDAAPARVVKGAISWISTEVDDRTRTVRVRANVENKDRRLLAHTFGKADITIREAAAAAVVPNSAIQWEGCCNIVFVRLTDDIFQTRKVKLGAALDGVTEVLIGVLPGEVVASEGSHVLKSEIMKSALGAGCADH